jgi:hypothetical protein
MKSFKQHVLLEMARPAKSFDNLDLNSTYSDSLKIFKKLGIDNANTFTIWDFIFRQLPEFFHQEQFLVKKKKASGTLLRIFILDLFKNYSDKINIPSLILDMTDVEKIQDYINRPNRGNRHNGMMNKLDQSPISQ